jgi:hypothetical protein
LRLQVHTQTLKRRFLASWCSVACGLNFAILVGACVLPLYIAWASGSFWIKQHLRWEQPRLLFTNSLVLSISGWAGAVRRLRRGMRALWRHMATGPTTTPCFCLIVQTTAAPFERVWTTSANANALLGASSLSRVPLVQSYTVDANLDGVPDELVITIEVRAWR